jgi:hypothetical protein
VTTPTPRRERPQSPLSDPDRYGVALVLILLTILMVTSTGEGTVGQLAAVVLGGGTLLFILVTSRAHRRTIRFAALVVVGAIAVATITDLLGYGERNPYSVVMAMLAFVAPIVIARRLLAVETITLRTVAGALCLYLLIGLFFSSVYTIVDGLAGPFFAQTNDPAPGDFVYFSYITITTVGYGDFTAASQFGRMLAATEALIGQIYLVAGVALLVSNLGRRRSRGAPGRVDLVDELRALAPRDAEDESVP